VLIIVFMMLLSYVGPFLSPAMPMISKGVAGLLKGVGTVSALPFKVHPVFGVVLYGVLTAFVVIALAGLL
jgi:hypothetical protein